MATQWEAVPPVVFLDTEEPMSEDQGTEVLHWQRSELFRLCDGDSQWAKRGPGDVKLLLHRKPGKVEFEFMQRNETSPRVVGYFNVAGTAFHNQLKPRQWTNSRCAAGVKLCFSRVGREVQGCLRNGKEMEQILVRIVGFSVPLIMKQNRGDCWFPRATVDGRIVEAIQLPIAVEQLSGSLVQLIKEDTGKVIQLLIAMEHTCGHPNATDSLSHRALRSHGEC